MTVKVMTLPVTEPAIPADTKPEITAPAEQKPEKAPLVYLPAEQGYEMPRVRLRRTSRRKMLSFGGTVLVQAAVSCVLAGALWAGLSFGGDEAKAVLTSIAELFR